MSTIKMAPLARALLAAVMTAGAWLAVVAVASCEARPAAQDQTMSDDRFWALIDRTAIHESDPERQLESLSAALSRLSPDEIEAFEAAFSRQMQRAYTWDLWGAAYVAHGGASDDGFEYFRRWLISKGREVYERVLAEPDDLADMLVADVEGVLEFEDFAYVARDVWVRKTGGSAEEFAAGGAMAGGAPRGEPFEDDAAHLSARYPKLWRRFGEHPLM
jgi:hypothetical protein